jgi:ribonuclease P protein component
VDAARLRRNAEIAAVWSEGMKLQHPLFAVRARPNGTAAMRLAVSAPRAVGRAVARNRARRRVREAFRTVIQGLEQKAGCDLVVIARPSVAAVPHADLREAAAAALATICARSPAQ